MEISQNFVACSEYMNFKRARRRILLEEFASITPLSPPPPCSTPRHCCLPEVGAKRIFCNYTVKPAWRSIEKKLISNPIKCVKISLSLCPAFCILAIFLLCTIWIRDRPKPCCTHNTFFPFYLGIHYTTYTHTYLHTQKSDNLQYYTMGRLVDRLSDQASDGPSIILKDWK